MNLTNIFRVSEMTCSIILFIVIMYHCDWYGYTYTILNDTNESNVYQNIYGLNKSQSENSLCNYDDHNFGKLLRNSINTAILIYLLSLIFRFIPYTINFSYYCRVIGLVLLIMSFISMMIYGLNRSSLIKNTNVNIKDDKLYQGYWYGFTLTLLLIIFNLLVNKDFMSYFTNK